MYYHVIDMAANNGKGEVDSVNQLIGSGYGASMALIEDHSSFYKSRLFLRQQSGNICKLISYKISAAGIGDTTHHDTFSSVDYAGMGELQVSPDGLQLAVGNTIEHQSGGASTGVGMSVTGRGEIRVYDISTDHTTLTLAQTHSEGPYTAVHSVEFTPKQKYVYYARRSLAQQQQGPSGPVSYTGQNIMRYELSDGSTDTIFTYNKFGDIRRGYDDTLYLSVPNLKWLIGIGAPDSSTYGTAVTYLVPPPYNSDTLWPLPGCLPLQPHKIYKPAEGPIYARELGYKKYEHKDHLGNVRVVTTDYKLSDVSGGSPADFKAEIVSRNSYFPFGMLQVGRNSNASEYAFGFNGMRKDDEMKGAGNSYDFKFRIYDPRVGRFLSVDPLAPNYPWNSPYAFAEGDVIRSIDLEGLEKYIKVNWHKNGEIYKTTIRRYTENGTLIDAQYPKNHDNKEVVVYNYDEKNGLMGDPYFNDLTKEDKEIMENNTVKKSIDKVEFSSGKEVENKGNINVHFSTKKREVNSHAHPVPSQIELSGSTIFADGTLNKDPSFMGGLSSLNDAIEKINQNAGQIESISINVNIGKVNNQASQNYSQVGFKNIKNYLQQNGLDDSIEIKQGNVGPSDKDVSSPVSIDVEEK